MMYCCKSFERAFEDLGYFRKSPSRKHVRELTGINIDDNLKVYAMRLRAKPGDDRNVTAFAHYCPFCGTRSLD